MAWGIEPIIATKLCHNLSLLLSPLLLLFCFDLNHRPEKDAKFCLEKKNQVENLTTGPTMNELLASPSQPERGGARAGISKPVSKSYEIGYSVALPQTEPLLS